MYGSKVDVILMRQIIVNLLPGSFSQTPSVNQLYQQNFYVNLVPGDSLQDIKLSALNIQTEKS